MAEKDLRAKIATARAEGYSDAEIVRYLVAQGDVRVDEARNEGYTDEQIVAFLAGAPDPKGRLAYKPRKDVTRTEAFGAGLVSGFENVSNTIAGIAGDIVDKFDVTPSQAVGWAAENLSGYSPAEAKRIAKNLSGLPGFGEIVRAGAGARQARFDPVRQQRPNAFVAGQITGEIAGTAPIIVAGGGLAAKGGEKIARFGGQMAARGTTGGRAVQAGGRALQMGGRSVQTGGVGVRAPSRAAVASKAPIAATRKGRMALRLGGGAAAGAAAAELTDQEIVDAALAGSVIPVIGTIGRRGLGFVYDKVRGQAGPVKAAEVMRNLISSNPTEIANALRDAPVDARQSTAQFLADQGLLTSELAAATRIAEASNFSKPLEQQALQRAATRRAQQAELRGGQTQAEAMENINAMREGVRQTAEPLLQKAMRAAKVGTDIVLPLEQWSAALGQTAAAQSRRAAGLYRSADEQATALGQMDDLGDPLNIEAINRQRGLVGGLEQRGLEAGGLSVDLGRQARFVRAVAEDLRAQGYKPIDIRPVVGRLRALADDAFAVSPQREELFTSLANALERRAARNGGFIDPEGLHSAKRDMGEFVANVLGQADPSAIKRGTSMMLGQTQKLINDAIDEAAGPGTPFADFNRVFSAGMKRAEQQDFARQLAKLTPQRFEKVVTNQDPEFVRDYFPDAVRIEDALPPDLLNQARQLNRQIAADLDVSAGGLRELPRELRGALPTGARRRVEEALEPGLSPIARGVFRVTGGVPGISGGSVAAEQVAREYAQKMASNAMRSLVPALTSPQGATRLLGVRSASNAMADFINRLGPAQRAALGQALQQTAVGAAQPVPAAPALPEIDVPGADMPFSNITYDEYGNYIGPRR